MKMDIGKAILFGKIEEHRKKQLYASSQMEREATRIKQIVFPKDNEDFCAAVISSPYGIVTRETLLIYANPFEYLGEIASTAGAREGTLDINGVYVDLKERTIEVNYLHRNCRTSQGSERTTFEGWSGRIALPEWLFAETELFE